MSTRTDEILRRARLTNLAQAGTSIQGAEQIARFARSAADTADLALMHANNEAKLAAREQR